VNHGGGRAAPDGPVTRATGYYWIHPKGGEPTIGHWDGDPVYRNWIVCGDTDWVKERDVAVLSERLIPPEPKG
jgi:hypothetical protein